MFGLLKKTWSLDEVHEILLHSIDVELGAKIKTGHITLQEYKQIVNYIFESDNNKSFLLYFLSSSIRQARDLYGEKLNKAQVDHIFNSYINVIIPGIVMGFDRGMPLEKSVKDHLATLFSISS